MTTEFHGKTVSKIFSKPEFQKLRKDFAKQGLNINKTSDGNGYELIIKGKHLLKAMNGNHAYLVRHVDNLFA